MNFTMALLLFLSTALIDGVLAYTNGAAAFSHHSSSQNPESASASALFRPHTIIRTVDSTPPQNPAATEPSHTGSPRPIRYDLGIGQNQPFGVARPATTTVSPVLPSVYEATQYFIEHEGIIEREKYGLPPAAGHAINKPTTTAPKAIENKPTQHQNVAQRQPVLGHRITDNSVLHIIDSHHHPNNEQQQEQSNSYNNIIQSSSSHAQALGRNLKSRYDLNTAWVEMLIHSEQQRALAAAAAAVSAA